jgi:predicted N-acetyltransferase YhbS
MEIRALRPTDDRSSFECGDEALDRFFRRFAGQNQFRHYLGVTYVATDEGRIVGFVTVAPRHIAIEQLPEGTKKKLPRYPMPVLGLVRLAVASSAQSAGLGAALLRFVLGLATKLAHEVGCAGVVVDAKPGAEGFYARYGFSPFETLEGQSDARPQPTAMWLPIQTIVESASKPKGRR